MREGSPSITALAVAMARGLATKVRAGVADPRDEPILEVLPPLAKATVAALAATAHISPWIPRAAFGLTGGLIDHVVLRTVAIDTIMERFVASGGGQLVILGAGLDMRAFRADGLADVDVFEVDHPATQAGKRAKVGELQPRCRKLHYVAIDFARDDLTSCLQDAGHDALRPTLWIWEGVVEYLSLEALQHTLATLGQRSAVGSELAMTYVPRCAWHEVPARLAAQAVLRAVGEPLDVQPTPQEMDALLRAAGLTLVSDTDTHNWHADHAQSDHAALIVAFERLAHARR